MGRPKELTDKERARLIAEGYRPVEVWLPDWENPALVARLRDECRLIAQSDQRSGAARDLDELSADLWHDIPS